MERLQNSAGGYRGFFHIAPKVILWNWWWNWRIYLCTPGALPSPWTWPQRTVTPVGNPSLEQLCQPLSRVQHNFKQQKYIGSKINTQSKINDYLLSDKIAQNYLQYVNHFSFMTCFKQIIMIIWKYMCILQFCKSLANFFNIQF